jgi:hypothetical protein
MFLIIVLLLALIFVQPLIVVHAWSLIAVGMFGAPALSYWAAFWGMLALELIFKDSGARKNDK